ncbi:HAD family hydrolase [Marinomonas sp. CT5]|uniref:hexitol phosphatase HxpB n=1 Tax=Marinomonas sp. CT5 TaxID=2066133 RepID=UPI0017DFA1CA|nr:hexitol phosphatase HxpB [Marinomonas sp. CT5]NVK75726.1 hexitol phosphatase HxpB [Oceanospirillaceae bacterium]QUX94368.1 HAD family hydrolase [Marinomonas sp. CT5]
MQAVIFDMDGLLIDSEPFWKQAEFDVFSSVGVNVTEDLTALTAAMTTREVTEFWFAKQPWKDASLEEVENRVVERVKYLIETQGQAMHGVHNLLNSLQEAKVKIGLATNSPKDIIPSVLQRLNIADYFMAYSSAEEVTKGKPAPDVYQLTLEKLGIEAHQCIAFEDSLGGVKAALAAGIKPIAVPHTDEYDHEKFDLASYKLRSLSEFNHQIGKSLLA